jgi:hypothetical protein
MADYVRYRIEVHPEMVKVLDDLQAKHALNNHCEVLQKAVQLLAIASDRSIYIERDDKRLTRLLIISPDLGDDE